MDNNLNNNLAFYDKAREFWEDVQKRQISKGLEKYGKVFDPLDWNKNELLNHVMEEMVDATHYIIGMKERMEEQERENQELREKVARLERYIQNNEGC